MFKNKPLFLIFLFSLLHSFFNYLPVKSGGTINNSKCPASGTAINLNSMLSCTATPDRFELNIFEMGLCTQDPLPGGDGTTFDNSSCTKTYVDSLGTAADLAGNVTLNLTQGNSFRPLNNEYSHGYIKFSNVVGLKGTYTTTGAGTFYSKSPNGSTSSTPPSENFDDTVEAIGNTAGCGGTVSWNGVDGDMKALLSCSTPTSPDARLIAVYKPDIPIIIDNSIKGIEVNFLVEDFGLGILTDGNFQPDFFTSAPFRMTLTSF